MTRELAKDIVSVRELEAKLAAAEKRIAELESSLAMVQWAPEELANLMGEDKRRIEELEAALVDASSAYWLAPWEATEIMRWNSGLRNGEAHDAYINMRDACLTERRGGGDE